jgi:inosose dehydratase
MTAARVPAAPISWGALRGPRVRLPAPSGARPGRENELGMVATEFGPDGFLPEDPRLPQVSRNHVVTLGSYIARLEIIPLPSTWAKRGKT